MAMTDDFSKRAAEAAEIEAQLCWCAGSTCSGCEGNTKKLFLKGAEWAAKLAFQGTRDTSCAPTAGHYASWEFFHDGHGCTKAIGPETNGGITVVSKSAYDALLAENEKLREALEQIAKFHSHAPELNKIFDMARKALADGEGK